MGILKSEQNLEQECHIFALPSYMAVLWKQKRFDTWFYSKVKFSRYTWIFMPINKSQNHWILLAANIPSKTVSILDSMNENNDKYVQLWRNYMKVRSEKIKQDVDCNWKKGNLKSSQQNDGHSCGPFILMNALALSQGLEPNQLTQTAALVMRQHVTNKIIETSRKPKTQRTICDMLDCKKPIKDAWVQCEVCGRWLHFKCIGLKTEPKNDYVCTVCDSQSHCGGADGDRIDDQSLVTSPEVGEDTVIVEEGMDMTGDSKKRMRSDSGDEEQNETAEDSGGKKKGAWNGVFKEELIPD
ncbi:uncharacterized protein [Mytilus edulis]|uniref:uncharacterized protein isoform X2 n=1 Tax=Mytilus edulis TaxID=6550 RepID=UPI0039EF9394